LFRVQAGQRRNLWRRWIIYCAQKWERIYLFIVWLFICWFVTLPFVGPDIDGMVADELERIAEVAAMLQQTTGCAKPQNSQ
jgi:hypothetical protein